MAVLFKVCSKRQRELRNGCHFMSRRLDRAVTEARIIAVRRKCRMYVVAVRVQQ